MQPIRIKGSIEGGEQTVAKFTGLKDAVQADLRKTVYLLTADLHLLVKRKLSGEVLKAPTGNLKGAVNERVDEGTTSIIGSVGVSVDTIPYARIHEFGGVIVPKTADYLTFKTPDGAWHKVKSVTMPERSYLRSSLAERRGFIVEQLSRSTQRAAKAQGIAT